jgi:hypothetical protein
MHKYQQQNEEVLSTSSSPAKGSPAVVRLVATETNPPKRAVARKNLSVSISIPEDEEQLDAELELVKETMATTATPDRDSRHTRSSRSLYWSNEALNSTIIVQSFRGGLLGNMARHNRDNDGNVNPHRKKLQLNTAAMDALQLPSQALSRSNSSAMPDFPLVAQTLFLSMQLQPNSRCLLTAIPNL